MSDPMMSAYRRRSGTLVICNVCRRAALRTGYDPCGSGCPGWLDFADPNTTVTFVCREYGCSTEVELAIGMPQQVTPQSLHCPEHR